MALLRGLVATAGGVAVYMASYILALLLMGVKLVTQGRNFWIRKDRRGMCAGLPAGFSDGFVLANGVRFFHVRHGAESGRPLLLFLHGFPESWYSWRHQLTEFAGRFDVVAINMRGYAPTEIVPGVDAYSLKALAADVPALVAALGHKQCVLVGHDWGGAVAWEAAKRYPGVVQRLIVLCCPPPGRLAAALGTDWRQTLRCLYMYAFTMPFVPELLIAANDWDVVSDAFRGSFSGLCNRDPKLMTDEDVEQFKSTFSTPDLISRSLTAALNYYRASLPSLSQQMWPRRKEAPRSLKHLKQQLQMPVLVMYADKDVALGPKLFAEIDDVGTNVKVHELRNCSHWAQQDRPEEVNAYMAQFLERM